MLKEARHVKQVPGERRRRWFSDEVLDLTVWMGDGDGVDAFELCYDKGKNERALRWVRGRGFAHERVDDGEGRPGRYKSTPILLPDGAFDAERTARLFEERSRAMDQHIAELVIRMLRECSAAPDKASS